MKKTRWELIGFLVSLGSILNLFFINYLTLTGTFLIISLGLGLVSGYKNMDKHPRLRGLTFLLIVGLISELVFLTSKIYIFYILANAISLIGGLILLWLGYHLDQKKSNKDKYLRHPIPSYDFPWSFPYLYCCKP